MSLSTKNEEYFSKRWLTVAVLDRAKIEHAPKYCEPVSRKQGGPNCLINIIGNQARGEICIVCARAKISGSFS